jgi:hypothetical protein
MQRDREADQDSRRGRLFCVANFGVLPHFQSSRSRRTPPFLTTMSDSHWAQARADIHALVAGSFLLRTVRLFPAVIAPLFPRYIAPKRALTSRVWISDSRMGIIRLQPRTAVPS